MARADTRTPAEILAARRAKSAAYARRWRAANPEAAARIQRRYWERKLTEAQQGTQKEGEG